MRYRIGLSLLLCLLVCGCEEQAAKQTLESVAKDWCRSIRASQVIPVYPPTADLRPGDVFLVRTPVQDQAKEYEARGFLPLDQQVKRISGLNYGAFYEGACLGAQTCAGCAAAPTQQGCCLAPAWFPSYSFRVDEKSGLKASLPVQSIPVGLGFLHKGNIQGSIAMQNATTYGIGGEELYGKLRQWAAQPAQHLELARLASSASQTLFLRVVNRVYLVQAMDVSLMTEKDTATGADVGDKQPLDLASITDNATAKSYTQLAAALTNAMKQVLPGVSMQFVQSTDRKVFLREKFAIPLVIGYLGFDVPILDNGDIGAPVATLNVLEKRIPVAPVTMGSMEDDRLAYYGAVAYVKGKKDQETRYRVIRVAAQALPKDPFGAYETADLGREEEGFWNQLNDYVSGSDSRNNRFKEAFGVIARALSQP